ncbi:GntR family transcriptional regulator [Actinoplanes regularis]|uniref:DNA-binding transcriptional regulator, GntR family n=1 Tax=Actinoplanes regularis TaxID=52697 RepID=A0A238XZL5_9ACTN|nr:GntR family transcriptional regulator [Actinoplanes regularis]GIE86330.1 GntR family transcriptional regulator [Actinoplanes regularis]GLW28020.1 GntR family transcriptional regulator [Actinoplanes regularis]SNR64150.1 DNA-binding transcriptional regulator, GntR family [Actinoplanes regularis]
MASEHDTDRRTARISAPSTASQARDTLRDAILRGEYLPGERLVEAQLCERLQASRFNVRAALQDLAAEGLVEVQRNRGAQVRKVSMAEAVEITEVRMVVEGLIAARAAERVTPDQATELDEIAVLMRRAVEAGEYRRYSDLNVRLHALVREIAGHQTADRIVETLRGQLVRHQYMLSLLPGRPQMSLPQHERIIAAIRDHDAKVAEAAMREHIASVIEALRSMDYLGPA